MIQPKRQFESIVFLSFFLLFLFESIILIKAYEECNLTGLGYDPTMLQTKSGNLKGACYLVPIDDPDQPDRVEQVFYWLSIPYAQPPVNELRFKKSKPAKPWSGVKNATQWPNMCIQNKVAIEPVSKNVSESEDCLYLNIFLQASIYSNENTFVDSNGKINYKGKAPIFFYIHPGHFSAGSSALEYVELSINAGMSKAIFITFNYRLGPLGFTHVAGTDIVGNQGFLDQHLALKWVYENAESFGGDPNRITISGTSAGAMFCGYHLIYQPSWPYFSSAFIGSGSILYSALEFVPSEEATRRSLEIFKQLGCSSNLTSQEFYECAKQQNETQLLEKNNKFFNDNIINGKQYAGELNSEFYLVLDGETFNRSVKESFKRKLFKKVPVLIGHTTQEGGIHIKAFNMFNLSNVRLTLNYSSFVSILDDFYEYFPSYPHKPPANLKKKIIKTYTDDKNQTDYLSALIKIFSEEIYICPTLEMAKVLTKYTNVYLYKFDHRSENMKLPKELGTIHGSDSAYLFGTVLIRRENTTHARRFPQDFHNDFTLEEKILSKRYMTYLSNFIKHKNPNVFDNDLMIRDSNEYPHWPLFTPAISFNQIVEKPIANGIQTWSKYVVDKLSYNYQHLVFYSNQTFVSSDYSYLKCDFWKDYNLYHI